MSNEAEKAKKYILNKKEKKDRKLLLVTKHHPYLELQIYIEIYDDEFIP